MNTKIQRLNRLIELLETMNGSSVKELAALLGVSEMTIRRDLKLLAENKVVKTSAGTAIYNPQNQIKKFTGEYELVRAARQHDQEKERIGRRAAEMIQPGDTILIDTGSTTIKMVPFISSGRSLTAICYNANILNGLMGKGISLIFAGGYFHSNTQMFESEEGIALIRRTRAEKAFISAAGVHQTLGVTCANRYEIAMKEAVIDTSRQKILLADSSKFGVVKSSYFTDLTAFHTVITDKSLPDEWKEYFKEAGIELYLV